MKTPVQIDSPARILVVAPQPFYEDRGTPIAVRQLLEALGELRYQVDLLTYPIGESPSIPGVRYLRVPNPLKIRSVPIGFSWRKVWFDLFIFFSLRTLMARHTYHCVHAVEEAAFLAVVAARDTHTPVIYDMQSSMVEQLAQSPWLGNRFVKPWLQACERWLIRQADYVVSSAGLAERVQSAIPHARIRDWRYPSPLFPEVNAETVSQLRAQLGIGVHNRVILYTGNFAGYQGVSLLIDAMPRILSSVPQAVLVLVGAEPDTERSVREQLARLLPADRYRMIPRQPREVVASYLALADVLVSPRNAAASNLPLKILEYLAAGKPIVATAIHAHHAVLTKELAVLVEPTPEALAPAVAGVLQDPEAARTLEAAARRYAERHLRWFGFAQFVGELHDAAQVAHARRRLGLGDRTGTGCAVHQASADRVSVIIPARNTGAFISRVIGAVFAQQTSAKELEVLVVDDGSTDDTAELARQTGARVVAVPAEKAGNPAAARNLGAASATGDPLVFLDADCTPAPGWLAALLRAHEAGAVCVGGSLAMPTGLPASARWDYFCGWYHAHERSAPGRVKHHPPCNLSICRKAFLATRGFNEAQPIAYSHEELAWQAQLQNTGGTICFEPEAVAYHWNRRGFGNLLKRNYRWAYSAIESKTETRTSRFAWMYRHPLLLSLVSLLLAPVSSMYIVGCWLRAGWIEPLLMFPVILLARLAYGIGMCVGGLAWLKRRAAEQPALTARNTVL